MEIKSIAGNVLFALESAKTIAEVVIAAARLRADLRGANLCEADLCGADLCEANLRGANLCGADLCEANLCGANLCEANLRGADLYGANLRGANLCGANLCGADLEIAKRQFIPNEGSFVAWKKCRDGVIVKLLIPEDAKRSHGTERKCRCSHAVTLDVIGADVGISLHDPTVAYVKGETVHADSFDDDRWNTCSNGIHFYLTRPEAEEN